MSAQNVEAVKRSLAHLEQTGEPLWEVVAPDIEVEDHDIPDAGMYRGQIGPDGKLVIEIYKD